jgi:hypothetical protein
MFSVPVPGLSGLLRNPSSKEDGNAESEPERELRGVDA